MVEILNSFEDLGKSAHNVHLNGCSSHEHPVKNWDMSRILAILDKYEKNASILDMGCGGSNVLRLLNQKGFTKCVGIDLEISVWDRITQLRLMHGRPKRPYRLMRMDLTKTSFPASCFDLAIALSVIEHGVNIDAFLTESYRILKHNGILFLTTDYWEPKIDTSLLKTMGLDWNIFSKAELVNLIKKADNIGFVTEKGEIPPVSSPFVHWLGKDYTFAFVTFRKC